MEKMKDLAFSPHYGELKKSSKKWLFIFLSVIFVEILILSLISYHQKTKHRELLKEIDILEHFIDSQKPIMEAKAKLQQQYEHLIHKKNFLKSNTNIPKLFLKKISKTIPHDCRLTTCYLKNNIIAIKGLCKDWLAYNNFFDVLSKIERLGSLSLKNSSKEGQYITFEIEFKLKKPKAQESSLMTS